MSKKESKRQKFIRIAGKRTNKVLEEIRKLGNCSNRRTYDYTQDDVRKIFKVLKKEIDRIQMQFSESDKASFSLEE